MTFDEVYQTVLAAPDDDMLRRQLADACKSSDPDRSRFIELQIAHAKQRRAARSALDDMSRDEIAVLKRCSASWSQTLEKYTAYVEYYRGAVESIAVDPYVFLEYGDWLFRLAPIRRIRFIASADKSPFPLTEVLASPLLLRLDSVCLAELGLRDADVERVAASEFLARCLVLELSYNDLTLRSFEALAAAPAMRNLLFVNRSGGGRDNYRPGEQFKPTGEVDVWGADIWDLTDNDAEGKALEQKYGYIPWLHQKNFCSYFDARWYVDHGILPVQPSRSAVAPTAPGLP